MRPSEFQPAELLTPAAFPHPVTRLEIRETHISWIVLTGPYAYKIKKSVKFEFIDTSTLAQRRTLCEEELRLNRRLASELYVDVVTITRDAGGTRIAGTGEVIEYAVQMKQFDACEELSALLERGAAGPDDMAGLAVLLADFHDSAPRAPYTRDFPHTRQLRDSALGNLAALSLHIDAATRPPELGGAIAWTHEFLQGSMAQFHEREELGLIRECHGDLHAGNIVRWRGRLLPFDCLEFDPKLRWIDVMSDVAFLVMDLEAHDRKDLAFSFLNPYLERTGDYAGVQLLSFYAVYRALVRAMVDSLGAERDFDHREKHRERLRMRLRTAAAFMHRRAPTLFIMHGPSGSGKSSLSERLAPQLGAIRIRSDVERKRLAGVRPAAIHAAGLEQGIYEPELSRRTYAHLLECAGNCLQGKVSVIVDAVFLKRSDRRLFHDLAGLHGIGYVILSCHADRSVLTQRIEKRRLSRVDPSDADVAVLDRQLESMDPVSDDERPHVVEVDTGEPQAYETALAAISIK